MAPKKGDKSFDLHTTVLDLYMLSAKLITIGELLKFHRGEPSHERGE